jgi:DNA-binding transcriptional ArsR family regulator
MRTKVTLKAGTGERPVALNGGGRTSGKGMVPSKEPDRPGAKSPISLAFLVRRALRPVSGLGTTGKPDDLGAGPAPAGSLADHSTNRLTIQWRMRTFNHMVELDAPRLDSLFHALGDATRRHMLRDLAEGERTVGQLARPFAISLAAASKHIKALESAGLIRREVRGRTHLCRLEPGPLASAHQWLGFYERFWTGRLDVLERLLRSEDERQSAIPEKGDDQ